MKSSLFIAALIVLGTINAIAQNSISGFVKYDNIQQSLITDSAVVKLYQGTTLISSIPVNSDGSYSFTNIADGTYKLKVSCTKASGGLNATDALLINLHFVGMITLSGVRLTAADVNASGGTPGAADGLAVLRRFTGMILSFLPPNVPAPGQLDWVSENINLNISGQQTYQQNIKVLCTGDVNGSFIPF